MTCGRSCATPSFCSSQGKVAGYLQPVLLVSKAEPWQLLCNRNQMKTAEEDREITSRAGVGRSAHHPSRRVPGKTSAFPALADLPSIITTATTAIPHGRKETRLVSLRLIPLSCSEAPASYLQRYDDGSSSSLCRRPQDPAALLQRPAERRLWREYYTTT